MTEQTWQPIETAPIGKNWEESERCLLFGEYGIQPGVVFRYEDGTIIAKPEGHYGKWKTTHWMPLPEPPQ